MLRHTMVGLRAVNTGPQPSAPAQAAPKSKLALDLVVRDEERRHDLFDQQPEEEEDLAPPPGHVRGVRRVPGEAFRKDAKGRAIAPCYGDVDQGNLADAWLLASCAAIAHKTPSWLLRRVRRRSAEDFVVELGTDAVIVTADLSLEGYADPRPNGQADTLWVALIEKAFAIREGGSYAHLETGNAGRALEALTGSRSRRISISEHVTFMPRLIEASKRPMVLKTRSGNLGEPLVGDHSYAILDVTSDGIQIYNPWGSAGGTRPVESMVHTITPAQIAREVEAIYVST